MREESGLNTGGERRQTDTLCPEAFGKRKGETGRQQDKRTGSQMKTGGQSVSQFIRQLLKQTDY